MARFAGTALTDYFNTPDFTAIGGTNMKGQSMQRNEATKAEGLVHGAGINSMAQVAQAGFQADAIKAEGAAAGQSAVASGIGSMVSGIAGGFGAMGSSALPKVGTPARANADMSTLRGWTQQDHNNLWSGAFSN
jgi:hypothetical protein